jgi:hypothetical protein
MNYGDVSVSFPGWELPVLPSKSLSFTVKSACAAFSLRKSLTMSAVLVYFITAKAPYITKDLPFAPSGPE